MEFTNWTLLGVAAQSSARYEPDEGESQKCVVPVLCLLLLVYYFNKTLFLDYITYTGTYVLPELGPCENILYLDHPYGEPSG